MNGGGVPAAVSNIFERAAFEAMILGLPASVLVRQWGDASVGKVGGRIFALLSGWGTDGVPAISFKCSELAFEMLPELERIRPAPYLARAKWVQVSPGSPLTSAELCAYVAEAHRMIAARLTRRLRLELGLDELIPARPQRY
jgi:predicted DNA-binding protein (MmcQ/YjbR family)